MTELTGATFAAMLAISGIAYMIFPAGARVPMQWGLDGKPTWAAPKLIGVLFSPILSLLVLSFASANDPQKVTSVLPMIAGAFLVFHVLHLVLAQWHFNANKS
jgi:hypothetical protein